MAQAKVSNLAAQGTAFKKLKLSSLSIASAIPGAKYMRVSDLSVSGKSAPAMRVNNLVVYGTEQNPKLAKLGMLSIKGSVPLSVSVTNFTSQEAGTVLAVTATIQGAYSSLTWQQIDSNAPNVDILGSGTTIGVVAPYVPTGCQLVLRANVNDGSTFIYADTVITVLPQVEWKFSDNGSLVPRPHRWPN